MIHRVQCFQGIAGIMAVKNCILYVPLYNKAGRVISPVE
jgi:hypothetical protein